MILKGTIYWACLDKQNKMTNKFQVDIADLSAADQAELTAKGIKVKLKIPKDGHATTPNTHFVTAKSNKLVKVYDKVGKELAADVLIGNGTKAEVQVNIYEWEFGGKTGIGLGLQAIKVTDLVARNASEFQFEQAAAQEDNLQF